MRHPHHSLHVGSVLATAALVVLAACGGSSSKGAAGSDAAPSTVKATKGGDFCKQVAGTYNEALKFAGANTGSPDQIRKELDKTLKDGADVIDNAPSEVKADLQVIQAAVKKFSDALARVNNDPTRLGPDATSAIQDFNTPQFQQANTHSQEYVKTHCGIDLGSGASGTATTTP